MGACILIVEDNALNLQLATDLLELAGHRVRAARDVGAARDALAEGGIDLVLLDIQIPGGGGEKLLEELRNDAALASLPVVAVTAFAMTGDRERLLARGFDGYLEKPIDTRTFAASVAGWLRDEGTKS